ncbi:hypothetical protein D3C86_2071230 [compost metagenome]
MPQATPATQRRSGRGWASSPVQMAAVMAARLMPCAPNGASSRLASPVPPISALLLWLV